MEDEVEVDEEDDDKGGDDDQGGDDEEERDLVTQCTHSLENNQTPQELALRIATRRKPRVHDHAARVVVAYPEEQRGGTAGGGRGRGARRSHEVLCLLLATCRRRRRSRRPTRDRLRSSNPFRFIFIQIVAVSPPFPWKKLRTL